MSRIKTVKGMRDLVPPFSEYFAGLEEKAGTVFGRYGYREVRTPLLEETALFARGVGASTDIVSKEMYSFPDGNAKKSLSLRPEGTASAVRAYLENRIGEKQSLSKWFYLGPMFRRERPAAGRYRQFFQIGAECIGIAAPEADAELLEMLWNYFETLKTPGLALRLNSIGDEQCRPQYRQKLNDFLQKILPTLCEDCQRRSSINPMRVLDCKKPTCQKSTEEAPLPIDNLCHPCQSHHERLLMVLDDFQIPYQATPRLVRGLDYYNRTAFEITSSQGLGAQDAVCGGGRYDGLIKLLGGPNTPAIGFAIGLDRLVMVLESADKLPAVPLPLVYVGFFDKAGQKEALLLAKTLRHASISCQMELKGGKVGSQLDRANKANARFVLLLGGNELSRGNVVLRDMIASEQEEIAIEKVSSKISEALTRLSDQE